MKIAGMLPHNGAVVTVLAVCGATHKESYFDIVMAGIVGSLVAKDLPPRSTLFD